MADSGGDAAVCSKKAPEPPATVEKLTYDPLKPTFMSFNGQTTFDCIDASDGDCKTADHKKTGKDQKQHSKSNVKVDSVSGTKPDKSKFKPEYEDILGNFALLKQVVKRGDGRRAKLHDRVKVNIISELPELKQACPEETFEFILGDGDVVQALDFAVALMEIGEEAKVISSHKYMYGKLGLPPDIPAYANFKLRVKLISSEPWDFLKLDYERRIIEARMKKDRGNFLYKRKEYERAVHSYTLANRIVDPDSFSSDQPADILQLIEFRALVLGNTSISLYKLGKYEDALVAAQEAVRLRPEYSKSYWRLGQAQEKLGLIDDAIKSFTHALQYGGENATWLHGELSRLMQVNEAVEDKQRLSNTNKTDLTPCERSYMWMLCRIVSWLSVAGLSGYGIFRFMKRTT